MVLYFHCISCAKLWAEPFRNFPLNCILAYVRHDDWFYVMSPFPHLLETDSGNPPHITKGISVQFLKILRAGFSARLHKRSCREIMPILPCAGGRWDGMGSAPSSLQAFPEKHWCDYDLCWLQVVTLHGWGTEATRSHRMLRVLHK